LKLLGAITLFMMGGTASLPIFIWYMAAPGAIALFFKQLFPSWVRLDLRQNFSDQHLLTKDMTKHAAVGLIAAGVIENIDILFVQGFLNTYEAGLLGGVSRIALLINLMAYSLGTVLNPRVAKYRSYQHLYSYIKKAWFVAAASLMGYLIYLPFSNLTVYYTIGPDYLVGVGVLNILMAAAFLSIAVMPFVALFFSFNNPWYFSVSGILQLVIVLAGNLIFVPIYGLEAAAWTRLVARVALFSLTIIWGWWMFQKLRRQKS
jgi:O-antigen/teichoic acid export membrane protein